MKKLISSFVFTVTLCIYAFSQERSDLLMEYNSIPSNKKIEVYLNFIDNKINEDKPFTYYIVTNKKQEISSKELKKDFRLKLKKNKKINDDSYLIILNSFKEIQFAANYSDHSKFTTVFYKRNKAWHNIENITFYYKDSKEKKLDKLKVRCRNIIHGTLSFFELKK